MVTSGRIREGGLFYVYEGASAGSSFLLYSVLACNMMNHTVRMFFQLDVEVRICSKIMLRLM